MTLLKKITAFIVVMLLVVNAMLPNISLVHADDEVLEDDATEEILDVEQSEALEETETLVEVVSETTDEPMTEEETVQIIEQTVTEETVVETSPVLVDENTGISVTLPAELSANDVSLQVTPINEDTLDAYTDVIGNDNVVTAYDISLVYTATGEEIPSDVYSTVKVSMPMATDASDVNVFRMDTENSYTELANTVVNQQVSYDTDHFTPYIVTVTDGDGTESDADATVADVQIAHDYEEIVNGDAVRVSIGVTVSNTGSATASAKYTLPANFSADGASGNIMQGTNTVGTYTVNGSEVTLALDANYDASNTTPLRMTIPGTAVMTSSDDSEEMSFTKSDGTTVSDTIHKEYSDTSAYSPALTDYITSLKITSDGKEVPSSGVEAGKPLEVAFNWNIPGKVFERGTRTFTYQLPAGFAIDVTSTGDVKNGDEVVGTYTVTPAGQVTIQYKDSYNTENNTVVNTMTIKGIAKYDENTENGETKFTYKDKDETVVVLRNGDFTVAKEAAKVYSNGYSKKSVIAYTVTISTAFGTSGEFTIEDTLSIVNDDAVRAAYDNDSFVIKKGDTVVTGWNKTVGTDSFTITGLPQLNAGEVYTLTYNVNVDRDDTATLPAQKDAVNNTVKVSNEKFNHNAEATITYNRFMDKRENYYSADTKRYNWRVDVYPDGQDLEGFTFTDTATYPVVPGSVYIVAFGANGSSTVQITPSNSEYYLESVLNLENDGKTFSFTWPSSDVFTFSDGYDLDDVLFWRVVYGTNIADQIDADQVVQIENTAKIINPTKTDEWEDSQGHTQTKPAGTTVTKSAVDTPTVRTDGNIQFNWSINITVSGNKNNNYQFRDNILHSTIRGRDTANQEYYDYTFQDDQYALYGELSADIKANLRFTINEDGVSKTYTYDEARRKFDIWIGYYSDQWNSYSIRSADLEDDTVIRSFIIQITRSSEKDPNTPKDTALDVTNIQLTNYRTILSNEHFTSGQTWCVRNRAVSGNERIDVDQYYTVPSEAPGNEPILRKMVQTKDANDKDYWTENDITVTYEDDMSLNYMILAEIPENMDSITITDALPSGMTLDSVKVRPFTGSIVIDDNTESNKNRLTNLGWTDTNMSNNIAITNPSSDNGNVLTVTVNNVGIGSSYSLNLLSSRMIAIVYSVKITDMSDGELTTSGDNIVVTKEFENTVSSNTTDLQPTVKATVIEDKEVISKTGKQIITDSGAYTSNVLYTIDINPEGLDLLENGDILDLKDVITSDNLEFKLIHTSESNTSIKLYERNADGSKGAEVAYTDLRVAEPSLEGSTYKQEFQLKVPDGVALILEYEYEVEGAITGTEGILSNTAELVGIAKVTTDDQMKGVNVTIGSTSGGVTIRKQDTVDYSAVAAKFTLERFDKTTGQFELDQEFDVTKDSKKVFDYFSTGNL